MFNPSLGEFLKLAQRHNVIPVYKEISADLDTPVSAFLKIKKDDYAFLLESVEGQENIARYSFLGSRPSLIFKSKGRNIEVSDPVNKRVRRFATLADPLEELKRIMQGFRAARIRGLPRFYGGLVGYISYDMVRFFEKIPDKNPDDLNLPEAYFMLTDTVLAFDHVKHTVKIICNVILPDRPKGLSRLQKIKRYRAAINKIEAIEGEFNSRLLAEDKISGLAAKEKIKISSNFKPDEFCKMVTRAKGYIRRGDVIQVVLSQRFKVRVKKEGFNIYRNLRSLNPSPYMFFLKFKGLALVGSSPEMLVRCEDNLVEARPIAGTRPRGRTENQDKELQRELLSDVKEKAEHIMLVDLGRNDLGRVCKSGTVKVNEFMTVERYSHVMHLVSDIVGQLSPQKNIYDCLRASFPAGTVSGSPKVRAMEIIDELENLRRGPYAGCVGYFSFSHNMDTGITLRTIILKDKAAYIQAGAGIVLDSKPRKEYYESVNKAGALIEALKRA